MMKISISDRRNSMVTLQIEGRLVDAWVSEVRRSCDAVLSKGEALIVDVRNVSFADSDGLVLLKELQSKNRLVNCSPFLAVQIGPEEKGSGSC